MSVDKFDTQILTDLAYRFFVVFFSSAGHVITFLII